MIEIMIEEEGLNTAGVSLKVIGIGGAGGNAINSMINDGDLNDVSFFAANTDAQTLNLSPADIKIQLGKKITKGLGAGSNPDVGRRAAEEDLETILEHLDNTDMVFLTAGLGGGTGSGAIPIIAEAAKELGILTVAIVTKPFLFEGKRRQKHAEESLNRLKEAVDTLIVIPNQKLLEISEPNISMLNAFALSNSILKKAIKGISDIITKAGHINVDFADVKTIMKDMGIAIMGTGVASGPDRAKKAATDAISSPLLENVSIDGAKGILINITGNQDLGLQEINEAASLVYKMVSEDATIILGSVIDESMCDELHVTVIATGLEKQNTKKEDKEVSSPHKHGVLTEKITYSPLKKAPNTTNSIPQNQPMHQGAIEAPADQSFDMENLDTPTFLRKKAENEKNQIEEIQAIEQQDHVDHQSSQ